MTRHNVSSKKKIFVRMGIVAIVLLCSFGIAACSKDKDKQTSQKPSESSSTYDELLETEDLGEEENIVSEYVKDETVEDTKKDNKDNKKSDKTVSGKKNPVTSSSEVNNKSDEKQDSEAGKPAEPVKPGEDKPNEDKPEQGGNASDTQLSVGIPKDEGFGEIH